jgi:hypothetical protein
MAKKILAILLALSFVVAFAACGGKGDDVTTTAPVETTEDPFAAIEETDAPTEAATDAPATEIATEAASEAATEVAVSDPTAVAETAAASEEAMINEAFGDEPTPVCLEDAAN